MTPIRRSYLALIAAAGLLQACTPLNTVPPPLAPEEPTQQFELTLPGNYEVRNVDFTAALASRGPEDPAGGVEGRGFIKVYAVDRDTGDSLLLLYENVGERKDPVQVVRFRRPGS